MSIVDMSSNPDRRRCKVDAGNTNQREAERLILVPRR